MFNKWIKPYLPRSLFGRAFLILIAPILLIQVVVGVVFVERLFQDVTRQMTQAVSIDLNFLIAEIRRGGDTSKVSEQLEIEVKPLDSSQFEMPEKPREFIDISGRYVIETLFEYVNGMKVVDLLAIDGIVYTVVDIDGKAFAFLFPRQRVSAANPHQLLVVMILAALLFSTIAAVFLRNQISPIRRLAKAADAFGKGQTLVLNPRGASEVRSAASAFLSMRARIERQIEQRTLMLSGVSHDLRTPLTRMKLSLSLLEPDEETEMMGRDIAEMEEILNEFLAFARSDNEEQMELVSPKALLEQIVENATRSGDDISLSFEGATDWEAPIKIRRTAIQRAISNLLSNAVKYGTKVSVTVYLGAGFVEFIVEDNGPGIRLEQREEAIAPFTRLDTARNQDKGLGVGLGLAIAADIARSHGGSLRLGDSARLGGLKAAIRVPR